MAWRDQYSAAQKRFEGFAENPIPAFERGQLPAGSEVVVLTGGGWGPPEQRDPAAVLEEVRQSVVSIAAAENDYGVVICDSELDRAATEQRRAAHRGNRS